MGPKDDVKEEWDITKSSFKTYRTDNEGILEKCFEFDWELIEPKLEYLIKKPGDREQVKQYLKANYKMLRDAYKLTAGQDSQGNTMSIGKISFGQLMQQCGDLVDNKTLKITDLDIAYIQVKAADAKKQNKLVPADQLVRHNFLEIMIRIADQKFIKSGLFHSY